MTPQDETIETYQNNFDTYKKKTPNLMSGEFVVWMDDFIKYLPTNGNIFELGSAHGRDARYLRERGFTVSCTDIIPQAVEELRADGFTANIYDFRDEVRPEWVDAFDGIIAKAVYLHATQEVFEESLTRLGNTLKQGGIFCLTFKLGEGEVVETDKLGGGRYFHYYTKQELRTIVAAHPEFELLDMYETTDGKWVQLLLRKK